MKTSVLLAVFLTWSPLAFADGPDFSAHLFEKFQVKACTKCHDFFEKDMAGLSFNSHAERTPDMCVECHTQEVTGFKHEDDWFARPGLYTSTMTARQTCETVMTGLNAKFKNETLVARDLRKHLFEDPRVLWAIAGATPNGGRLPDEEQEGDLAQGGLAKWKDDVNAWIKAGMKCK